MISAPFLKIKLEDYKNRPYLVDIDHCIDVIVSLYKSHILGAVCIVLKALVVSEHIQYVKYHRSYIWCFAIRTIDTASEMLQIFRP